MKRRNIAFPVVMIALAGSAVANAADYAQTGYRTDTVLIDDGGSRCGSLVFNADGTYENGFAWRYGGIVPPDYGAFAEGYSAPGPQLCAAVFDFSTTGDLGAGMNILVYNDAGGTPGAVVYTQAADPGPIAFWPSISRHTFALTGEPCTDDNFWVGYWGNWPGDVQSWFVAADLDGFGGLPYTNIVAGQGYPTGWNHVSIVWGPTQAIGIGAEIVDCYQLPPFPVLEATWGRIKSLFN